MSPGDFVAGGFCRWGILSLGDFVMGAFVTGDFVMGDFDPIPLSKQSPVPNIGIFTKKDYGPPSPQSV